MVSTAICAAVITTAYLSVCSGNVITTWACQPNVPYVENRCGKCTCNEDHELTCDPHVVCLNRIESILFNCEVGINSTYQCNDCQCVQDVGTVCTDYPCPRER